MDIKNTGVLIAQPLPTDYVLGGTTSIEIVRIVKDWTLYLPGFENQYTKKSDMLDCVTMSGPDHSISTQLNYLMHNNLMWDEALTFFHNNRYIVDGFFSLSSRFNAKMNGTDKTKGNYLNVVADSVRIVGCVPESIWPTTDDMTWDEFYKPIPQSVIDLAKKALWYIKIAYQWVPYDQLTLALQSGPVQTALEVCPGWSSGQIIESCSGLPLSHAVMIYKHNDSGNWSIRDHYEPYGKILAPAYEFPQNMQYIITMKPITLRKGMQGENVLTLQENLSKLGYNIDTDSFFGPHTEAIVQKFQANHGLAFDGIAGPITLGKIASLVIPKTLLDAIIHIESNGDDMCEGDLTLQDHAYGALQIRQGVCDDINAKFKTNYNSKECLGNRALSIEIWNKYWLVYPDKQTNEDKSRTWNGGPGWKQIYFKANKTEAQIKYCKNIDAYWKNVSKFL